MSINSNFNLGDRNSLARKRAIILGSENFRYIGRTEKSNDSAAGREQDVDNMSEITDNLPPTSLPTPDENVHQIQNLNTNEDSIFTHDYDPLLQPTKLHQPSTNKHSKDSK
jgi:hypothetical protein